MATGLRRQRAEGVLDAGDRIEIEPHDLAQIRFGEDGHAAHARVLRDRLSRR